MTYLLTGVCLLVACDNNQTIDATDPLALPWEEIERQARGQTVSMVMWQGSPAINAYMENYVKPALKERYDINLEISGGQGAGIVSTLMSEIEAGRQESVVDMMWINGATYFQLLQIGALYGPFVDKLPHARYIDLDDPFIGIDFQKPVNGMECPWGNLQFSLVYDSARVADPPRSLDELEAFVQRHPGTFTISNDFTGMTLLKCLLIELSGSPEGLNGEFDEEKYQRLSTELWTRLQRMKPYLWKEGRTFPNERSRMNQLFAGGELLLMYGNNDAMAENEVLAGLYPTTTRSYVLEAGTIRNTHYLGIARHAVHKAGALVAINFMISPEAQLRKMDTQVWGDYTVLDLDRLPPEWREKFAALPPRRYALQREKIVGRSMMEPAPEYMTRLYDDFREQVIEK